MLINRIKNVLYIGNYYEWYPRNYIFINGLKEQNIKISTINLSRNGIKILKFFFKNFKKLKTQNFDLIIYHSTKFTTIFILAKLLAYIKRIPLVNDYHISNLLSYHYDRKPIGRKKRTLRLFYWIFYYIWDFMECHLSNIIILDTASHISYFYEKFNVSLNRFRRVFVGARDDIFYPMDKEKKNDGKVYVGFYGSYLPLQGVKYIIKSIKLLESEDQLKFILLGNGVTYKKNRELANKLNLKNVEFIDRVPIEILPKLISNWDISLGIFGDGLKTTLVIPNKVYSGIAMKIPMITCDSPAIREVFTDKENILLCEKANPESLAEAIKKLKNNEGLREKIKENAYTLFKKRFTIEKIGKRLIRIFRNIV